MSSMGRARRKRSERKEAKNRQKASVQQLEDERAALRAENERLAEKLSDSGQPPMGSTTGTAGGAAAAGGAVASGADGPDGAGHSDRVIGSTTDLTTKEETSTTARHRDAI